MSLTILDFVKFIAPELIEAGRDVLCPIWPADVFAVCCSILHKSGAIRAVGTGYLCEQTKHRQQRIEEVRAIARQWRIAAGNEKSCEPISRLWETAVVGALSEEVAELASFDKPSTTKAAICDALVRLCCIADEAFAGVGINPDCETCENKTELQDDDIAEQDFWRISHNLLADVESDEEKFTLGATLCRDLSIHRVRVLPKAQPPSNGLSIRSLTTYLSLCPPVDVPVKWYQYWRSNFASERKCNLLLVPWPLVVSPSQFVDCRVDHTNEEVGWFTYRPDEDWHAPVNKVKSLLEKGQREVGEVDVVVLPEAAVTEKQYDELKQFLASQGIPLIAGVCSAATQFTDSEGKVRCNFGKNFAALNIPFESSWKPNSFIQHKHHRWKIDGSQIESYGIAAQLNPQKSWWEGIKLHERKLNFFALRRWLCSCVLICEDLARLDPAGQLVRAVAPDLVIALLFDGPQLATRWPAYHATVLADDPGCSVLTLSCLGMTQLSRPRAIQNSSTCSRVIGMWRDPRKGHVQIDLPQGKEAALLTITRCISSCGTADGRLNSRVEGAPAFASLYYI